MVLIQAITTADRDDWARLWGAYLVFYETDLDGATTDATFARITSPDSGVHGGIARDEAGRAVGFVHWLTHSATWTVTDHCYLEDLFVDAGARGGGVGRALIEHVRVWAQDHGSSKVYWHTAEHNATARALYDKVATRTENIQYQILL